MFSLMTKTTRPQKPHPIDVHAGMRLKMRRTVLGLSLDQIANAAGLTYQQIQKYENGINRFGMSRAYELATILDTEPGYFFENVPNLTESEIRDKIRIRQKNAGMKNSIESARRRKTPSLEADATRISEAYIMLPNDTDREMVKKFLKFIQSI